ncbi:hypothetical protein [Paraburkholderia flagellata]|uniref:hypothetical protein n=1 Tax=Paraburkholderia flagellata TaxID=2883241 RepID=UPI001F447F56|nr:hypothetical protein [Paraburkholderia flagellata]
MLAGTPRFQRSKAPRARLIHANETFIFIAEPGIKAALGAFGDNGFGQQDGDEKGQARACEYRHYAHRDRLEHPFAPR